MALEKIQGHPFLLSTNDVNDAAADDFVKSDHHWLSLPHRLRQLCRKSDGSCRINITAAVWAATPNHTSLQDQFRDLLQHSLRNRCGDGETGNEDDDDWFECVQKLQWIRCRKESSILAPFVVETIHTAMQQHVEEKIGGEYEDDAFLPGIQEWNQDVLIPWVQALVGGEHDDWSIWCKSHIVECFVQCRTSEIFSVIAEYPDSHPAVKELSHCLERSTKMYPYFAQALQDSLTQRLLHPGANTGQILEVYINTIKVLRHIDPSDRLIVKVAEPVRTYLRGRTDTVRCIITNLTDQEAELYQELQRPNAKPLQETKVTNDDDEDYYDEDDDDEDEEPDMTWRPPPPIRKQRTAFFDPSIGRKGSTSQSEQQLDILSILVSIYGSKELFVDEYRTMLADKLLTKTSDYNTDAEVHTLELLKLRFGEDSMRHCEIMIKDTDDSKRIMTNIQSSSSKNIVDASIISHIFWPSISSTTFQHHPRIQQNILDPFSTEYGRLKNPRRLVWYNQLGTVEIEIQTDGDNAPPKSITCTPLLATLISYFEDQPVWKVSDLAEKVGMPATTIQKRLAFWVHRQVITYDDTSSTYSLSSSKDWSRRSANITDDGDEDDNEHPTFQYAEEEANDVFCSYVIGMLQRYKELPLYRIHEMLKLFCNNNDGAAVSYNKTQRQLSQLLNGMEKVECRPDGMYKLVEK